MTHKPPYVVLFFLKDFGLITVFGERRNTHTRAHTHKVSGLPFGPRQCDWTALFVSTIGFPLGGQTELMLQGVRVDNHRQLANQ